MRDIFRALLSLLLIGVKLTAEQSTDFKITSTAFKEKEIIPVKYTCDSEDKSGISPQLEWKNAPKETQSFVLIMDDPDTTHGSWTHWVIFNIPATVTKLEENIQQLPEGTTSGKNSGDQLTYRGACPPDRQHRYFFKLYALDTKLELAEGATKQEVEESIKLHTLAKAELIGVYGPKKTN